MTSTRSGRGWRRLSANQWSLVIGVIGVLVAVLSWQLPKQPPADSPSTTASASTAPGTTTSITPGTTTSQHAPADGSRTYLDGIRPETGAGYLRQLPRPLATAADLSHPITIDCPSNNTGDQVRSISYPLQRRYLDFTATLRPYFPNQQDREAVVRVTARVGIRQTDGTLTQSVREANSGTMLRSPEPLSFSVEGVDVLTLTVECDIPEGQVILAAAQLTHA